MTDIRKVAARLVDDGYQGKEAGYALSYSAGVDDARAYVGEQIIRNHPFTDFKLQEIGNSYDSEGGRIESKGQRFSEITNQGFEIDLDVYQEGWADLVSGFVKEFRKVRFIRNQKSAWKLLDKVWLRFDSRPKYSRTFKYDRQLGSTDVAIVMSLEYVGPEDIYPEEVELLDSDLVMDYVRWNLEVFSDETPVVRILQWNEPSLDNHSTVLVGLSWGGALSLCKQLDYYGGKLVIEIDNGNDINGEEFRFDLVGKAVSFSRSTHEWEGEEQEFQLPRSSREVIDILESILGGE